MIQFSIEGDQLILSYEPEQFGGQWVVDRLKSGEPISLSGQVFSVSKEMLKTKRDHDIGDDYFDFAIGRLVEEGEYVQVDREVLTIDFDLLFHHSITLERKTFVAERNISIFKKINELGLNEFRIGGDHAEALPSAVFAELLKQFPGTYELNRYAEARVGAIVRNYVPVTVDSEAKYVRYMRKRKSLIGDQPRIDFAESEAEKYKDLIAKIEAMLSNTDTYIETQWQVEIFQVLQFIFPKYIKAIREAPVRDSLAKKDRSIDFLLVDASGYVDAIEIKQPFAACLVTSNLYRDNHVPMRELSGTIMQLEKYLFHLNRWGQAGEMKLNERYADQLPEGMELKIVNPSGMIIMGRDQNLSAEQRTDFEVIRRKYRHVVEIITYDDLLRRLKVIQRQFIKEIEP